MTDERRLFLAIRSGKRNEPKATFQYLYSKYKPLVCFIAARYFREKADIEDVVQCEDGQDEILPRFEEIQKCKGGSTMKKIEEEFLQTFESSLGAEVSFEEIEKKIDPEKYRREPSRRHAKAGSRRSFGILSVFLKILPLRRTRKITFSSSAGERLRSIPAMKNKSTATAVLTA